MAFPTGGCPSSWKLKPQFPSAEAGTVSGASAVSGAEEKRASRKPAPVPRRKAAANRQRIFAAFFVGKFSLNKEIMLMFT